jgi:hypothetical protein
MKAGSGGGFLPGITCASEPTTGRDSSAHVAYSGVEFPSIRGHPAHPRARTDLLDAGAPTRPRVGDGTSTRRGFTGSAAQLHTRLHERWRFHRNSKGKGARLGRPCLHILARGAGNAQLGPGDPGEVVTPATRGSRRGGLGSCSACN